MENCYLYIHISPSDKMYVGISLSPIKRWRNGKGYEHNYLFYRAIQKYGWESFRHIIIENPFDVETAKSIERKLIQSLNLTDPRRGYNLDGGGGGALSPYTRELMSKARKGRRCNVGHVMPIDARRKVSASLKRYYETHDSPTKGSHLSEEAIERLRNRVFTSETRAKMKHNHADVSGEKNPSAKAVVQFSKDGQFIAEYPYAKLAAKTLNLDLSTIIKCCRHPEKYKSHGGFRWEYANQA